MKAIELGEDRFPYSFDCHHAKPHKIVIKDHDDEAALWMFREDGWGRAGYCFADIPEWLKPRYAR